MNAELRSTATSKLQITYLKEAGTLSRKYAIYRRRRRERRRKGS